MKYTLISKEFEQDQDAMNLLTDSGVTLSNRKHIVDIGIILYSIEADYLEDAPSGQYTASIIINQERTHAVLGHWVHLNTNQRFHPNNAEYCKSAG